MAGFEQLLFTAALRYEDYSDFGNADTYRLGLLWQPVSDITIRSAVSTSFRSPGIFDLYESVSTGNNVFVFDVNAPNGPTPDFRSRNFGW